MEEGSTGSCVCLWKDLNLDKDSGSEAVMEDLDTEESLPM